MEHSNLDDGNVDGAGESMEDAQLRSLERRGGGERGVDGQLGSSEGSESQMGGGGDMKGGLGSSEALLMQRGGSGGISRQLEASDSQREVGGGVAGHLGSSERRRVGGGEIGGVVGGERDEDGEEGLMRWVRALDLQFVGGCRVDERLKPLLKFNVLSGVAEDRLLAQLSQHFEVSEVGMLARCLCIPLVSVRVGKVNRQGNLVCPVATRGHLNLNLLPSSNMQISFIGDDGCSERLALINNGSSSCDVIIEEITADSSGRCFLLKISNSRSLYYWVSEKSRQLGQELLAKMKDLLQSKPSLSDLTGIPQSRLDSFVIHLRSYILGCTNSIATSTSSNDLRDENEIDCRSSCPEPNFSYAPVTSSQIGKEPRLDFFKEQVPHLKNEDMENLKKHGDVHLSSIHVDSNFVSSSSTSCSGPLSTCTQQDDKWGGAVSSHELHCHDIPTVPSPLFMFNPFSNHLPLSQLSVPSVEFSPQYCWCTPGPSLHQSIAVSRQPAGSSELLPLPASLSSLLSDASSAVSSLPSNLPIDFSELRALALPTFHSDPIIPIPLSASSITLPSSQQISTFTPFMSDPIVHIPVIDVCSSGQGYFVSGGPAISSVIAPLRPLHVNPLVPKTESAAEKSARETIEMLIASAPPFKPNLGTAMPNLLDNAKKLPSANVGKSDTVAVASWSSSFSSIFSTEGIRSGNASRKPEECNGEDDQDDQLATPEHAND